MNANGRKACWWSIAVLSLLLSGGPRLVPGAWAEGGEGWYAAPPAAAQVAAVTPAPVPEPSGPGAPPPSASAASDEAPAAAPREGVGPDQISMEEAESAPQVEPREAQEGLESPGNASSGLPEPPSASAASDEAPAAAPREGVGPDRESAEKTDIALQAEPKEAQEYDPWEPFNEKMFAFDLELDHHVLKPVATAWNKVVPHEVQRGLGRMFDNVFAPRRFVNCLLQGKVEGAGRELVRFVLNSTVGLAGFLDPGGEAGIKPCNKDAGQTLAVWGMGPGPYLVLPFLPPMTVRDGIGLGLDSLLNPINYVAPFASVGVRVTDAVNSRSQNLEVFQDVEEGTLDMYSAVRNAYLQHREQAIRE